MSDVIAILPAVTLLGVGLLCILAARAVKTSPIVAFILAGLIIGPFGFGLVEQSRTTELLAQLGVVFLLFEIGLGFSSKTLRESGRDLVVLGPLQMLICGAGFTLAARAFGLDWPIAILVGLGAGISATAVVSATMAERGIVTCPLGKSSTALLVFQDIAGIFLLVFAVSLETGEGSLALALGEAGLKAAAAAFAALIIGRFAARPALTALARTNSPEVFTAAALFLVLATAAATGALGLSLTLGAFLAGVIVAETPFKTVVKTEAKPFGALLLGFFFITVGMALDWRIMLGEAPLILAALAALMIGKTVLTGIAALISGWSRPGATQLAFLTAQGSEFGLVLLALPAVSGALGAEVAAVLVAASALSLALTPMWTALGMKLAKKLAEARVNVSEPLSRPDGERPILVFAMTPSGRMAVDGLRRFNVPYVAIESDADRFMQAVSDGYDVTFGDPSDVRLMKAVGVINARALALGASRYEISKEITPYVNETFPDMSRFVVVKDEAEKARHEDLNMAAIINRAVPEGLDFAVALLRFAQVDEHEIAAWMREVMDAYEPEHIPGMREAAA
jgi:CPA2 family monovalent cation:H+ antiporter-2